MFYRTTNSGSSLIQFNIGIPARVTILEFANVNAVDASDETAPVINLSASVSSASLALTGRRVLVGAVLVSGSGVAGGATHPLFSIDSPLTEVDKGPMFGDQGPSHAVGYRILDPAAGSYDMDVSLTVGSYTNQGEVATIIAAFECVG